MPIIGTSPQNRYSLLLIFTPILSVALFEVINQLETQIDPSRKLLLTNSFMMFMGESLAFILELISSKLNLRRSDPVSSRKGKKTNITLIQNTKHNITPSYSFLIIFLITLIDLIDTFLSTYITQSLQGNSTTKEEMRVVQLFITIGFCCLVWHYFLYKHQVVSLVFLIIGSVLLYLSNIDYRLSDLNYSIPSAFFAINLLLAKWVLEKKHVSPYLYVSIQGIMGMGLTAVLILLSSHVEAISAFYYESFDNFNLFFQQGLTVFYFVVYVVFIGVLNVMFVLINKYYSPTQVVVTYSLKNVLYVVVLVCYGIKKKLSLYVIGNALILVGVLIYNEIVILYFGGLEYNTRKEIAKRGNTDIIYSLELINECV